MSAEELSRELRDLPPAEARRRALDRVRARAAEFLGLAAADVAPDATFVDLGFDSLRAVDFKDELQRAFGVELRTTLVFDHPTPAAVADHVLERLGLAAPAPAAAPARAGDLDALDAGALRARLRALEAERHAPIAIVGLGCRLPGDVHDPESFWRLLEEGRDAVTEVPPERFAIDRWYDPDPKEPGKLATRRAGVVLGIDRFDARFFGMSAREAKELDPRQRLLMETVWEALEHGGLSPDRLRGRAVGVFLGILSQEYFDSQTERDPLQVGPYHSTGGALSTAAGRISHHLGWTGPSIALDTACSSSLVAVHLAVASLRRGESELAVAAGVNALLDPINFVGISQASMLSPDGRCKTFDARADGYVRSEGAGVAVLKPLARALADGDRVLAVIRGTATNQDGASGGLTVPYGPAQVAVIRAALADARAEPGDVSYVEAHGTGTALGDPIEVAALDQVFGGARAPGSLLVGSVKTNVGHGETVAGITGLIKVVLALQHERVPRNLHFETPSLHVDWARSVVRVPAEPVAWPRGARVAGVSSFGFSGTNAHVVVAEAPPAEPPASGPGRRPLLLPLSAATPEALDALIERWRAECPADDDACADACFTAAVGRARLPHRAAFVAPSAAELARALAAPARARGDATGRAPRVAFLFTGQGSQHAGMARELHAREPAFRAALDACAAAADGLLERPLYDVLWADDAAARIDATENAQCAILAVEVALAAMWRAFGVEPALLLGHSVGEIASACVAGVLSVEDAMRLCAARGRLMKELCPEGAMLAVIASEARVRPLLAGRERELAIAALNGPENVVLSGAPAAIAGAARALEAAGVACVPLAVSRAFHSPLVEPMLGAFEQVVRSLALAPPAIPIVSCVDPRASGAELADPAFWVRHARAPVRFQAAAEALLAEGPDALLEVGPQPVLCGMARRFAGAGERAWIASLRRGAGDWASVAAALAELHARGLAIDWDAVHAGDRRRRVDAPRTPFQRERYWYERRPSARRGAGAYHALLGRRVACPAAPAGTLVFESALAADAPAFLDGHRVLGRAIVPAAGLIEVALAAGARAFGGPAEVEGLAVLAPLEVEREERALQLVLDPPAEDGARAFRLFRVREDPDDEPALHATGRVRAAGAPPPTAAPPAAQGLEPIDPRRLYAAFDALGLAYRAPFRGLVELAARDGEALARARLDGATPEGFEVHPALLDACFQAAAAALHGAELAELLLPIGVERVRRDAARIGGEVLCHVRRAAGAGADRSVRLDVRLLSPDGARTLLLVEGLQLVRADAARLARDDEPARALLHAVRWQPAPRADDAAELEPGEIALLAPEPGSGAAELADALAAELARRGRATARAIGPGTRAAVVLDAVDAPPGAEAALVARAVAAARAALRSPSPPRLVLVTRGASAADRTIQPAGAALHGLAHVLALEHPELKPRWIDLDLAPADAGALALEAARLAAEILAPDREDRVALRGAERLAPRLARVAALDAAGLAEPADAYELRARAYGSLEHLELRPLARRAPGPGEVEVELEAAALNFKDVLHALGLLRAFSEARGIARAPDQPLGFEGAGVVVAAGAGVERFAPGDRVVVSHPGALATHVTAPESACIRAPDALDAARAAALPTVYVTALHALKRCARLAPGESVLIHAAAGGVGQAAIQVARRAGARILATASRPKHAFLRAQGVEHVLDSRTGAFADAVLAATGGRGVDVVLNSLRDAIEPSLACLARGGRFVEIGKLGVKTPEEVARARPDVAYFLFDLADELERDPALRASLLADLKRGLADRSVGALPVRVFAAPRAVEAFRFLAQARNVGKVVLALPAGRRAQRVRADRTYVVTGGLGALGRTIAARLVEDGARHLVLIGRRGLERAGEAARADVAALERAGATVRVVAADVADRAALAAALEGLAPPLAGVVHAAGVLKDGAVQTLDPASAARVLAPKVDGARHLDHLTRALPLDFFVLFSSMAGLLGARGQAVYAAANAALDAIAEERVARGLPALSIQWGPWKGSGMAADLGARDRARLAALGLSDLEPKDGAALFARLLREDRAAVAVLPVAWPRFLRGFQAGAPPFLSAFAGAAPAQAREPAPALAAALAAAAPDARAALLADFLERELVLVLGFPPSTRVDPRKGFSELGVDSLLAVDLKNRVEAALERALPATLLFDHPTLEALVAHLDAMLAPAQAPAAAAADAQDERAALLALDEAELARRLAAELDALPSD